MGEVPREITRGREKEFRYYSEWRNLTQPQARTVPAVELSGLQWLSRETS